MGYPAERLPFDPLDGYGMKALARMTGVSRQSLQRWRRDGVPVFRADEIAVALGYHPVELWTDRYNAWVPVLTDDPL